MTAPGIHAITPAEYHADCADEPSLSASIAHLMLTRSPLHAWTNHPRLNPAFVREEKTTFDLGTAAHLLFLQPEMAERVATVDAKDWRTKDARAHQEASRAAGLIPVLERDWLRTQEMVGALRDQLAARDDDPPLFADGKAEQALIWEQEGVTCRSLLDWLRDDFSVIDDLKTVPTKGGSANPRIWERTFWGIGADVQAVFYRMGVKALTGKTPDFRFAVVESRPPYALSVIDLAPPVIDLATRKIEHAMRVWRDCLDRDEWPAYDKRVYSIELDWRQEERFEDLLWDPDAETESEAA